MMVNRYSCPCENTQFDALTYEGEMICGRCAEDVEFVGKVGCVRGLSEGQTPNSVLQDLVEDWNTRSVTRGNDIAGTEIELCADELEKAIEDCTVPREGGSE